MTNTETPLKNKQSTKAYKKKRTSKNNNQNGTQNGNKSEAKEVHFHPAKNTKNTKKKIPYRTKLEKNKQIVIADSNKDKCLDLFCYIKCDNSSPLQVKRARGLVFHGENLILKTFPYTDEYSLNDTENINRFVKPIFETPESLAKTRFFRAYEGSLIRVFHFDDDWYISTHRKLDAFKSKWSSQTSFGEMFLNGIKKQMKIEEGEERPILEIFFSKLDKNKSYMFLVLPIEDNRIVCQVNKDATKPTVYHVGTYENFPSNVFTLDEKISEEFPFPEEYKFTNFNEFSDEIKKTDITSYQGIIIFGPKNQLIKVLEPDYFYLFHLRGNEQSIRFRYLQIRSEGEKWKDYGKLYPNFVPDFKDYERCLEQIAEDIFGAYTKRYIKKENVVIPQEEFQVMRKCYQWYREDPKNNKINVKIISEAMNYEEPTALNKMIKRLKLDERQKNEEKTEETKEEIKNVTKEENTEETKEETSLLESLEEYPLLKPITA